MEWTSLKIVSPHSRFTYKELVTAIDLQLTPSCQPSADIIHNRTDERVP
jgi:hypothetical protein